MSTQALSNILAIVEFLGENMTEEQAAQLMDKAKRELSIAQIRSLSASIEVPGNLHYELSQYDGEMGGLSRW